MADESFGRPAKTDEVDPFEQSSMRSAQRDTKLSCDFCDIATSPQEVFPSLEAHSTPAHAPDSHENVYTSLVDRHFSAAPTTRMRPPDPLHPYLIYVDPLSECFTSASGVKDVLSGTAEPSVAMHNTPCANNSTNFMDVPQTARHDLSQLDAVSSTPPALGTHEAFPPSPTVHWQFCKRASGQRNIDNVVAEQSSALVPAETSYPFPSPHLSELCREPYDLGNDDHGFANETLVSPPLVKAQCLFCRALHSTPGWQMRALSSADDASQHNHWVDDVMPGQHRRIRCNDYDSSQLASASLSFLQTGCPKQDHHIQRSLGWSGTFELEWPATKMNSLPHFSQHNSQKPRWYEGNLLSLSAREVSLDVNKRQAQSHVEQVPTPSASERSGFCSSSGVTAPHERDFEGGFKHYTFANLTQKHFTGRAMHQEEAKRSDLTFKSGCKYLAFANLTQNHFTGQAMHQRKKRKCSDR